MLKVYNLLDKLEYLEEVVNLEYEEWANNKEDNKNDRINQKIRNIKNNLSNNNFCKLILLKDNALIGFISIFPNDSDECTNLTPWYATMYVKKEYRGNGYSIILNNEVLEESRKRNYKEIFLKTNLNNYYEKFGAKFVKILNSGEKLYKFEL